MRAIWAWCCAVWMGSACAVEAPYLKVLGDGPVERLPLKLTEVHAQVLGPIADVQIRQTFENRGAQPIEAVYVFPASAQAAVYAMTMTIGTRRIRAQIQDKQQARKQYQAAIAAGQTASLLESVDEHLFKMQVGNVLPGEAVAVELHYTELLVPDRGVYELVVPNTVADRFGAPVSPEAATVSSASAEVIDYAYNFSAELRTAVPLVDVSSPSHDLEVHRLAPNAAQVLLGPQSLQKAIGRDLRLQFRLLGDAIQTGLLVYPEGDGGYFLLQMEPPARVLAADVPPREFIFVVDVSGSMTGKPIEIAQQLIQALLATLSPKDFVNVLMFSGGSELLSKASLPVSPEVLARASQLLDQPAGGGTELVAAMERALAIPRAGVSRSIVVVTDGAITADAQLMRSIRAQAGSTNVFALGVGPSVQRDVIERIARAGFGEPFIVDDLGTGTAVAERLRTYIDRPLLTGVRLGAEAFAPLDANPDPIPDLLAERPLSVAGRYRGGLSGALLISGQTPRGAYTQRIPLASAVVLPEGRALRYFWARRALTEAQDDYDSAPWSNPNLRKDASARILALGLEHSLLTRFTSFVAVDAQVRTDGTPVQVQQPAVATGAVGNALAGVMQLQIQVGAASAAASACEERRRVDARDYCRQGAVWADASLPADAPRLRLRAGSAAVAALLRHRPELRAALALGQRVVLRVGNWAIEIGPSGFSDVPAATWARVLGSER
ncbi:MAG: VIT and VWA domain-containing protein [Lysobacterales bacterium]